MLWIPFLVPPTLLLMILALARLERWLDSEVISFAANSPVTVPVGTSLQFEELGVEAVPSE